MKIAVADDEQAVREQLCGYLRRYAAEHTVTLSADEYENGDALLAHYVPGAYDLLLLDIEMPGTNGMDAARRVRRCDDTVALLFITNMAQYAINGYEVDAVDYILKPLSYYEFSLKFQKALRRVQRPVGGTLAVEAVDGVRRLDLDTLYYVEVMGHYLIYHTASGDCRVRGGMDHTAAELEKRGFARIHKSYLIAMRHIQLMKPTSVTVNGTVLPVGRAYKDAFVQRYMSFLGGQE